MGKHDSLLVAWVLGAFLFVLLTACGGDQSTGSSSSQTSGQSGGGPSLVGTWIGQCRGLKNISFKGAEFRDDGTLVLDDNVGKYLVNGDRVQITLLNYTFEYSSSISQSGNLLTLSDSSGGFCVTGRSGTNAVQEAAQSLLGAWTGSACHDPFGGSFTKVAFTADGNATIGIAAPEKYSVPDAGDISFPNYLGDNEPIMWEFSVSGLTLMIKIDSISGSVTCSFQKSA